MPINDTPLELSVFWTSKKENRIKLIFLIRITIPQNEATFEF